jgi:hypothetical protein
MIKGKLEIHFDSPIKFQEFQEGIHLLIRNKILPEDFLFYWEFNYNATQYKVTLLNRKDAGDVVPICFECSLDMVNAGADTAGKQIWRCPKCNIHKKV